MEAVAYIYRGDWVADCPRPDCGNVEFLLGLQYPDRPPSAANRRTVPRPLFACTNCLLLAMVSWPPEDFRQDAMAVLMERPIPDTRNWYPSDHPTAVAFRVKHGETVDDLRDENRAHGVGV